LEDALPYGKARIKMIFYGGEPTRIEIETAKSILLEENRTRYSTILSLMEWWK
jgi:hypothetical protein